MIPKEAIEAAAQSDAAFDGRGFDGLSAADKRRYRDRASHALTAAFAAMSEPVAWVHAIKEPGRNKIELLSRSPNNPFSHWAEKHLNQCQYMVTPLYAAPQPVAGLADMPAQGVVKMHMEPLGKEFEDALYADLEGLYDPSAPQPAAVKVKVKPLEWEEDSCGNWFADTGFGSEFIQKWSYTSINETVFEFEDKNYDTAEAAKAAAQADYEARILSTLTPAPDLASENERLRAAISAYIDSVNGEPEKDIWDTGDGKQSEGADRTSSDWAWKAYDDKKQSAFEGLLAALERKP